MRAENNGRKHSALKRIIPAAAMFALSTVMLSTSTYAWFTMNKEVEMTGLAMSATVGEGMEISLAAIDNSMKTDARPADTDSGWKNSVIVSQYYSDIGKLRPASTVNAIKFYNATDASNGGKSASKFEELALGTDTMAAITARTSLETNSPKITSNGKVGYYVDIPVYLRTNKKKGTENGAASEESIYCKLKIQKRDADGNPVAADSNDLYKAIRVAFVESGKSSASIFAVDNNNYTDNKAVSGVSDRDTVTVTTTCVADNEELNSVTGAESGLKIPFAVGADKYGHLDFIVRVWIEGESEYCSDDTSGQDWNIDLAFSMGEFSSDNTQNP